MIFPIMQSGLPCKKRGRRTR
jgi:intergrase/recombinase